MDIRKFNTFGFQSIGESFKDLHDTIVRFSVVVPQDVDRDREKLSLLVLKYLQMQFWSGAP